MVLLNMNIGDNPLTNGLTTITNHDKVLFISHFYCFQYVHEIPCTETDRINSLISHYFDGMDFKDPVLIRISELNK